MPALAIYRMINNKLEYRVGIKFKVFLLAIAVAWVALFVAGFAEYPGSKYIYVTYSLTFLALIAAGFTRQVTYSFTFLAVFLWMGFWLKLVVYLVTKIAYIEPVGNFTGSASSWDEVLWVGIAASTGVIIARVIYSVLIQQTTMKIVIGEAQVPAWYLPIRKSVWLLSLVCITIVSILNAIYGIYQIGPLPRTILIWPLNAVVFWLLSIGFAMWCATLLYWDSVLKVGISSVYGFMSGSVISSISLLSRGFFLFQTSSQLYVFFKNIKSIAGLSRKQIAGVTIVFLVLFFFCVVSVTALRNHYYFNESTGQMSTGQMSTGQMSTGQMSTGQMSTGQMPTGQMPLYLDVSRLIVGRWIGLEGAMAVSSYKENGMALFKMLASEKASVGKLKFYEQIANSVYQKSDLTKFNFGSAPGAAAFFYYSGSSWIVLGGMCLLTLFLLFSEFFTYYMTKNPFLCSVYGLWAAFSLAQFDAVPQIIAIHFFMDVCGILFIWFIQRANSSFIFNRVFLLLGIAKK